MFAFDFSQSNLLRWPCATLELHEFVLTVIQHMSGTISGVDARDSVLTWFADTTRAGEDCNAVCAKKFNGVCDREAGWPDTEAELRKVAEIYNIKCDSFCHRNDIGSAPIFMPPGERDVCSGTNAIMGRSQCIFGDVQGPFPRCDRHFRPPGGNALIQICPCKHANPATTTRTDTTVSTSDTIADKNGLTRVAITNSVTPSKIKSRIATASPTPALSAAVPVPTTITTNVSPPPSSSDKELPKNLRAASATSSSQSTFNAILIAVTVSGSVFGVLFISVLVFLVICTMRVESSIKRQEQEFDSNADKIESAPSAH